MLESKKLTKSCQSRDEGGKKKEREEGMNPFSESMLAISRLGPRFTELL